MRSRVYAKYAVISLVLFVAPVLASVLFAQSPSGTLRCQVNDPSGAAMTQATVLVTSATGQTQAVQGNRDGIYEFKGLAPGKYNVKAIAKGFALYEQRDVEIAAGQVQKLTISLGIEQELQKITVSGEAPTVSVNPENNASSLVIWGRRSNRSPITLMNCSPNFKRWLDPQRDRVAARFTLTASPAGSFRPSPPSLKSE